MGEDVIVVESVYFKLLFYLVYIRGWVLLGKSTDFSTYYQLQGGGGVLRQLCNDNRAGGKEVF
jgi:hypothetical protein